MADPDPFLRLFNSYKKKVLRPVSSSISTNNNSASIKNNLCRIDGIQRKTLVQFMAEIDQECRRDWWVHQIIPLRGSITDSYFNGKLSPMERGASIIKQINGRLVKSTRKTEETNSQEETGIFGRLFREAKNVETTGKYKGQIIFIALHERAGAEHLHIIHDCSNSARTCKCSVLDHQLLKRHADKKSKERSGGSSGYIKNFAVYSVIRRESYNYVYTPSWPIGFIFEDRGDVGGRLSIKCALEGEEMDREYRCLSEQSQNASSNQSNATGDLQSDRKGTGRVACNYKTKFQKDVDKILKFFDYNLVSPISKCTLADNWLNDPFLLYITEEDKAFKVAVNIFTRRIRKMRIKDIYDQYSQSDRTIYFNCVDDDFDQQFWGIKESHEILDRFLTMQFGDLESGNEFIHYLYYLLTRQVGKKNCLIITGNPNGGKSYLIKSIANLMIVVGKTTIVNKNNNFCFSGFDCASLIIMDELNYEPFFLNDFKKMFSGEETNISVKYKDPRPMSKTPIIIMSNDANIIPRTPEYQVRCNFVHFNNQFTNRTMFRKQLHPFMFCERWKQLGKGEWPKFNDQFTNKYLEEGQEM
uniref:Putative nonstructural protein n=1 Tax=Phylloscopus schwarzi parvoviridae sp. TaxID=2794533 RepID=A0A8A4XDL8_9VIRU|nr:MAG: putative nonstructural protein [Phylloscopus schwarzi parvoviridae sp.]